MKKLISIFALVTAICSISSADTYTYSQLIDRLTNLETLATLPQDGEKCAQWSSWDRDSKYDATTGKYVAWDANGDNAGIIRTEGDLLVLGEITGPGVIWRTWSAAPTDGRVMIYLDGSSTPAIDMPFKDYFNSGRLPFNYPGLVHEVSQGWNNYIPIPFAKSCKIVAEKNWGNYYHFTYTSYPAGTVLPTFSMDLLRQNRTQLKQADLALRANRGDDPAGVRPGSVTKNLNINLPSKKSVTALRLTGPQAITAIKMGTQLTAQQLRQVVMRIKWDGEASPSVWCPIGDFFGSAPGVNTYRSLPLGVTDDEMYCYWYMPFDKSAVIEFSNDGKGAVPLSLSFTTAPLRQGAQNLARFHAKWHRDAFLPSEPERQIDWPILKTTGSGRFVGVALNIYNPGGGWWGEGDEKFWVDGEKFPSTIGTGSEDYFGYAWCNPALFQHAYHNQTLNQNSNAGNVSVNRWQITDNVPFLTQFEADIEKYFPNSNPTLYSSVAYWYLSPKGVDPYGPTSLADRTGYYKYEPYKAPWAIEAESMRVVSVSGGQTSAQAMGTFAGKWSNGTQLWWTGAKPSDSLVLEFNVAQTGTYQLGIQLAKAVDYGIVELSLDGKPLGAPIDLYHEGVIATGLIPMGSHRLDKGKHQLTARIAGASEKAVKGYMVGLDYISLKPVK